jgi:hypothetical protein
VYYTDNAEPRAPNHSVGFVWCFKRGGWRAHTIMGGGHKGVARALGTAKSRKVNPPPTRGHHHPKGCHHR